MPTLPGPVDADGNITVPAEGGATIYLKEQTTATPPVQVNISAAPLKFVVPGRFEITPAADPGDALGRLLVITEAMADQLPAKGVHFALLDISTPTVPIPLWQGTIRRGT